ncbi:YdcF family protein, partial [Leptospira borgpetersenii serovar Balcanica]|nr:YdcF family protein [Leptospira borgpetersenii serovar Balcanica]
MQLNHEPTAYVVLGGGLTEADPYHEQTNNSDDQQNSNTRQLKSSISASHPAKKDTEKTKKQVPNAPLHRPDIVLNKDSLIRMQTVMWYQRQKPLPIILTGVESAWMQDWLNNHVIE